jgi:DNA-binding NarL/FixJ family response regulator
VSELVRVLIADDDPLFVDALEAILGAETAIEIAGRAHDGAKATRLAEELTPTSSSWIWACRSSTVSRRAGGSAQLRRPPPLSCSPGSSDRGDVEKAYDAGAAGYLTKDRIAEDLVAAVLSAAA